jgi:hypothetical protein
MRPWIGPLAIALLLPLLCLWPGPWVATSALLVAPDQEGATHLWGLWAAWETGQPLVIETTLLAAPEGARVVLVDPAHLPVFGLGTALGGVVLGYNLVLYAGLVLASLGGAALARQAGGDPRIGALVGATCPSLVANAADGQTEGFAVGWVALGLAALLEHRRQGGWRWGLAAALAWGAAAYGGPYNGVWAAIIGGCILVWDLRRPPQAARTAAVLLGTALLCLPLAQAIFTARDGALPGSAARAGLPALVEDPSIYRGGERYGADLLDLFVPGPITGAEAPISHTAYLGVVALGAALLALRRDRSAWPYLAGALGFSALALGPYLFLAGSALQVGERPLLAPAGMLIVAAPTLGRLTRWYRAGAVATLLLAPLVSRLPLGRPRLGIGLAVALIVDALLLAPLQWPLHHAPPPDARALGALPAGSVILELPLQTTAGGGPDQWRDQTGLLQAQHGHAVGSGMMGIAPSSAARTGQRAIEAILRGETEQVDVPVDFTHLAIDPRWRPLPAEAARRLSQALGPPLAEGPTLILYRIPAKTN